MRIKKILVPVDFSKCSINALKIAAEIALRQRATIEVVNAIHMPNYPHADVVAADTIIKPLLSDYEKQIQEQFAHLPGQVPGLKNVDYSTRQFVATAANAIYTCVEKDDIDLVVMGTKGSHDRMEKLLGSLSADVIRFSKVPVLVIPENVDRFDIKNIGFATDLNKMENTDKLSMLTLLAKMCNARLHIFHIFHVSPSEETDLDAIMDNARERLNLLESFTQLDHSFTSVDKKEALSGIMDFVEKNNLDLLAMHPRQHGFWDNLLHGSMTKKVVMQIKIPLLTIHE